MKKVAIITINNTNNYGNRLQNYAVQQIIEKLNYKAETIENFNNVHNYIGVIKQKIKNTLKRILPLQRFKRYQHFSKFEKNIKKSKFIIYGNKINNKMDNYYDYYTVGSDQVWNPNFGRLTDVELLAFTSNEKRISFSASFGINKLPEEYKEKTKKELSNFNAISVREATGKNIVEELTSRKDVKVLVDPTMLLAVEEWDKVSKRPKQLKSEKYVLTYFLGRLSDSRKNEIYRIAKENNCEVINILDKNSPFYGIGPSEFLYLEKNAFLICTDSFHSSVFAILYNRPFIVFEREGKIDSMNSRIETLINKFELENRIFKDRITEDNLKHDYTKAYEILDVEREKSKKFLREALN